MGQGVYTSIPLISPKNSTPIWPRSRSLHAPPNDKLYGNPTFGLQVTGNSNSIRAFWKPLRNAGASARAMLVQAAAAADGRSSPRVARVEGRSDPRASGRKLSYGAVAMAAGKLPPKEVPLKDPKDFV